MKDFLINNWPTILNYILGFGMPTILIFVASNGMKLGKMVSAFGNSKLGKKPMNKIEKIIIGFLIKFIIGLRADNKQEDIKKLVIDKLDKDKDFQKMLKETNKALKK